MAEIRIKKRKGKYTISYEGKVFHENKDLDFIKGWLKNQVKEFKYLYIEI